VFGRRYGEVRGAVADANDHGAPVHCDRAGS
jgi:hypothetical protein